MDFSAKMIPIAGSAIFWAYKYLVVNSRSLQKYWEARLEARFEQKARRNSLWTNAVQIIESQRLNPLELSWEEAHRLVQNRKEIWANQLP